MDERGEPEAQTANEPAPPSPGRRPLRRRVHDKVIAGVAGGLADHFGIRAFGLRVVFGFSAFVVGFLLFRPFTGLPYGFSYYDPRLSSFRDLVKTGAGLSVVAYFALWVFVPAEDTGVSAVRSFGRRLPRFSGARTWFAMLALVGGASVLGYQLGLWSPDVIWPFLLIGVGVLLFRRDAERANDGSKAVAGRPAGVAGTPGPPPTSTTWPAVPAPSVPSQITVAPPRPPRERSPLGWLVLGIALLVVGGAAILQNLGGLHLRLVRFPALALVVLGAGMLIGTVAGRARWLILPALMLALLVLAFSVIHVPLEGGVWGGLYEYPRSPADVKSAYRAIQGDVTVDLSGLKCLQTEVTLSESSAFGGVTLVVPFDAHVIATGSVGFGRIGFETFGADGLEQHLHRTLEPRFGDGPTIVADLQSGIGNVYVYREGLSKRQRDKACT